MLVTKGRAKNQFDSAPTSQYYPLAKLLALFSSDAVDMSFEIAVFYKPCDHVLLKGRNGAGIKSESFVKFGHEVPGEHHVAHAQGRGDRF